LAFDVELLRIIMIVLDVHGDTRVDQG